MHIAKYGKQDPHVQSAIAPDHLVCYYQSKGGVDSVRLRIRSKFGWRKPKHGRDNEDSV